MNTQFVPTHRVLEHSNPNVPFSSGETVVVRDGNYPDCDSSGVYWFENREGKAALLYTREVEPVRPKLRIVTEDSQLYVLREYFTKGGSLTQLEAMTSFGVRSLSSRVSELRKLYGLDIRKHRTRTPEGRTVVRYALVSRKYV